MPVTRDVVGVNRAPLSRQEGWSHDGLGQVRIVVGQMQDVTEFVYEDGLQIMRTRVVGMGKHRMRRIPLEVNVDDDNGVSQVAVGGNWMRLCQRKRASNAQVQARQGIGGLPIFDELELSVHTVPLRQYRSGDAHPCRGPAGRRDADATRAALPGPVSVQVVRH